MKWSGLILLCASLAIGCGAAAPGKVSTAPTLHLGDLASWTLVVAADAIPSEQYAAAEFQRLFKAATGAELRCADAPASGHNAIFIGDSPALRVRRLCPTSAEMGEESLCLRLRPDTLVISGGRPRGTLYGVYEFFERYAGVRFLTADHTHIPAEAATAVLPAEDYDYTPPFSFRASDFLENRDRPDFATRHRLNTVTEDPRFGGQAKQQLISHSIDRYLPVSVYGGVHPEYYALVNGVRQLAGGGGGPQVCTTNPDVIRIVTTAVERELEAHPNWVNVSVSQMDNDDCCQCPTCSALIEQEGTPAAPLLHLVNRVAARVAQTHPGVRVGTLIYWYTRRPPRSMRLEPNVEIQLCSIERCILHPLTAPDCERNRAFMEDFVHWQQICRRIWLWNYNTNFINYDLPFPNLATIGPDLDLFRNGRVNGVYMQASYNTLAGAFSELHNYVIARGLWRPLADNRSLVEEFCRLHYGSAAPPILAALDDLHDNAEALGLHPRCFSHVPAELGIDARVAHRFYAHLQAARELASDDTFRERVDQVMIPALKAIITTIPYACRDGLYRLDATPSGAEALSRYAALTARFHQTRVGESVTTASYLADMDKLRRGLPALTLENDIWRMNVLPEEDGRIAELIHKPTGRQLIAAPSSRYLRWARWDLWPPALRTSHPSTDAATRTWTHSDTQALITTTLPDRSTWQRTISLSPDGSIQVQVNYTATQAITAWALQHRPAEFAVVQAESPADTTIWLQDASWHQVNRDWSFVRANDMSFPLFFSSDSRALAFYDRIHRAGLTLVYTPGIFSRSFARWSPTRGYLSFELITPPLTLKPGQHFAYHYTLSFLDSAPLVDATPRIP